MLNDKQRSELSYIEFCKYEIFKRKTLKLWGKCIIEDLISLPRKVYEIITGLFLRIATIIMFVLFPAVMFIGWITLKMYIKKRDKKENIIIRG